MNFPLLVLSVIASFSGYSQTPGHPHTANDTSVNCISHWKRGETRVYTITHEKNTIDPNKKSPPFKFTYEAWITVIDSTVKTYTIQWVFHLPAGATLLQPALADTAIVYNGMKMIFRTTNMGEFVELVNWEEVRDAYARQMELSLPQKKDSMASAALESAKRMFNSREMVEASMIKEIQLFHFPYGYKFTTTQVSAYTTLPNPLGGDPYPAIQTYQVHGLHPGKDTFTLIYNMRIDKVNTRNMLEAILKKMDIKGEQEKQAMKEKYDSFDLQDSSQYNLFRSSGWIRSLNYKRNVVMTGNSQYDIYTITLKD